MAEFTGNMLTNQGLALQAKAQTGVSLQFTRVGLGDGVQGAQVLSDLTALMNERKSIPIQSIEVIGDGTTQINAILTNADVPQGFYIREIGIFANDPDQGEILYSIAYAGEKHDYLPAGGGSTAVEQVLNLVTVIGNAPTVTAVFAQVAAIDVNVQRHFVDAATASGQTTFVLPWPYNPRKPNLAIYRDGAKLIRGLEWDPPAEEMEANTSSSVVFKAPVSGIALGLEFFSIPVDSGTHKIAKIWHKMGDYTVTNANNEHILTNRDSVAASIFTLDPLISPGMRFTVVKSADFILKIQAPSGETIIDSTPGGYLVHFAADQVGASVTLVKIDNNKWTVERGFGTWETDQAGV
ncbi:MAG: phage tail protein [Desulfobacterium sp.]|nr:phage tail protein [Desulfobacterium sp.]